MSDWSMLPSWRAQPDGRGKKAGLKPAAPEAESKAQSPAPEGGGTRGGGKSECEWRKLAQDARACTSPGRGTRCKKLERQPPAPEGGGSSLGQPAASGGSEKQCNRHTSSSCPRSEEWVADYPNSAIGIYPRHFPAVTHCGKTYPLLGGVGRWLTTLYYAGVP